MKNRLVLNVVFFSVTIFVVSCSTQSHKEDSTINTKSDFVRKNKFSPDTIANIRIPFIENQGQMHRDVKYYATTSAGTIFVTNDSLVYNLPSIRSLKDLHNKSGNSYQAVALEENFINCDNQIDPKGISEGETKVSAFIGPKENWKNNLKTFKSVTVGELWKNIELTLSASGNNVEKIFTVKPGGEPEKIVLNFQGADKLSIDNKSGELVVGTKLGDIYFTKPLAYQKIDGRKVDVVAEYQIQPGGYSFKIGDYRKDLELIIDPLLASTYVGGSMNDIPYAMTLDSSDNIFITGETASLDYPTTVGAYSTTSSYMFISKFNSDLTSLVASTFFGGSSTTLPFAIKANTLGEIVVTGNTSSPDFPTTAGAYDNTLDGTSDAFVSKLSSDLSSLIASTYFGGTLGDVAHALTFDSSGNVVIAGITSSTDLPMINSPYDSSLNGAASGFISKLNPDLTALVASTYLGGSISSYGPPATTHVYSIVVGSNGNIIVGGTTIATDFPTTVGSFDTSHNGYSDIFISILTGDLSSLSASTLLGGLGTEDFGLDSLKLDVSDNVIIAGSSSSSDYPTTAGAFDNSHNGGYDIVISKLSPSLSSLLSSTFLGGPARDGYPLESATGLQISSAGEIFITGFTQSTGFPTSEGAYDTQHSGQYADVLISRFSSDLTQLKSSTLFGNGYQQVGTSLLINSLGHIVVSGYAYGGLPTTSGCYDSSHNGMLDAFLMKISSDLLLIAPTPVPTTLPAPSLNSLTRRKVLVSMRKFSNALYTVTASKSGNSPAEIVKETSRRSVRFKLSPGKWKIRYLVRLSNNEYRQSKAARIRILRG